jgi:RNA polymerase sigma-70 factor (ECF subfamily)
MSEMENKESRWLGWAKASQKGDKNVYKKLLIELSEEIELILNRKIFNSTDREDVKQEILFGIHKALPSFNSSKNFRPWFLAIVHYKIVDYIRNYQKTKNQEDLSSEMVDSKSIQEGIAFDKNEVLEVLFKKIELLPRKQAEVFRLMKLNGKSLIEIQKITGMSISAIKVTSHRAMKNLKSSVSEVEKKNLY